MLPIGGPEAGGGCGEEGETGWRLERQTAWSYPARVRRPWFHPDNSLSMSSVRLPSISVVLLIRTEPQAISSPQHPAPIYCYSGT